MMSLPVKPFQRQVKVTTLVATADVTGKSSAALMAALIAVAMALAASPLATATLTFCPAM